MIYRHLGPARASSIGWPRGVDPPSIRIWPRSTTALAWATGYGCRPAIRAVPVAGLTCWISGVKVPVYSPAVQQATNR